MTRRNGGTGSWSLVRNGRFVPEASGRTRADQETWWVDRDTETVFCQASEPGLRSQTVVLTTVALGFQRFQSEVDEALARTRRVSRLLRRLFEAAGAGVVAASGSRASGAADGARVNVASGSEGGSAVGGQSAWNITLAALGPTFDSHEASTRQSQPQVLVCCDGRTISYELARHVQDELQELSGCEAHGIGEWPGRSGGMGPSEAWLCIGLHWAPGPEGYDSGADGRHVARSTRRSPWFWGVEVGLAVFRGVRRFLYRRERGFSPTFFVSYP